MLGKRTLYGVRGVYGVFALFGVFPVCLACAGKWRASKGRHLGGATQVHCCTDAHHRSGRGNNCCSLFLLYSFCQILSHLLMLSDFLTISHRVNLAVLRSCDPQDHRGMNGVNDVVSEVVKKKRKRKGKKPKKQISKKSSVQEVKPAAVEGVIQPRAFMASVRRRGSQLIGSLKILTSAAGNEMAGGGEGGAWGKQRLFVHMCCDVCFVLCTLCCIMCCAYCAVLCCVVCAVMRTALHALPCTVQSQVQLLRY
jgi:hypothetical protein